MKRLGELSEKALRETVLAPLLARMGYKAVTIYHGPRERGKDIICYMQDQLGGRECLAVVAKATDLNGSVSSSDSLREVLHQITQCFDVPYEDLFGMHRLLMDRVWVVTSKKIVSGAEDSIFESLRKTNLDKLTRFISGERLVELINEHYPAYWDASLEPIDILREQNGRITHFCRQLLAALGGSESDIEATLNQAIHSYFPPQVIVPATRELSRLGPYRVEVDTITEPFSHNFHLDACDSIRETFFKTKEHLFYAMFDVDEVMEHYEDVMKKTDPEEFLKAYNETLGKDNPFCRATWGRARDAVDGINALEEGLGEFQDLVANLKAVNKLEWATALVDSVSKLEPEIDSFLVPLQKEEFSLFWQIDGEDATPSLRLLHQEPPTGKPSVFKTDHSKSVTEKRRWNKSRTRPITVRDITSSVQERIREHLDKMLPPKKRPPNAHAHSLGGREKECRKQSARQIPKPKTIANMPTRSVPRLVASLLAHPI